MQEHFRATSEFDGLPPHLVEFAMALQGNAGNPYQAPKLVLEETGANQREFEEAMANKFNQYIWKKFLPQSLDHINRLLGEERRYSELMRVQGAKETLISLLDLPTNIEAQLAQAKKESKNAE